MVRYVLVMLGLVACCLIPGISQAHFGLLLPERNLVLAGEDPNLKLTLAFCHPMEQKGLAMARPKAFGVVAGKDKTDLLGSLQETRLLGQAAWQATYAVKKPGVYVFYFDPQPYWEASENKYLIHQTKTYVAALGEEEHWDREVGLKAEIIPLTRPFGLYAGNVFQGIVKFKGKPVPFAEVEVEYWNADGQLKPPNDYFITQVVKADKDGVFTFAVPCPGWWGFAALNEEKAALVGPDGKKKDVEYGAVLWVNFAPFPGGK